MIQAQFQTKIQILRTNNGTEYFNSILRGFLLQHGIVHQSSCLDTPQQNGIATNKKIDTSLKLYVPYYSPQKCQTYIGEMLF